MTQAAMIRRTPFHALRPFTAADMIEAKTRQMQIEGFFDVVGQAAGQTVLRMASPTGRATWAPLASTAVHAGASLVGGAIANAFANPSGPAPAPAPMPTIPAASDALNSGVGVSSPAPLTFAGSDNAPAAAPDPVGNFPALISPSVTPRRARAIELSTLPSYAVPLGIGAAVVLALVVASKKGWL